jgi:hypothetical protein
MKSFNKLFLQLLEIVTDKERCNILTAEKTAEIIERDGSVVTGFVVTDKYGNVGIIDKGAVRWIDKTKFNNMMHNEIEFNGDDLVKSVESFASTLPTKIEYFEVGICGWGIILRREIDTNGKNYISHTEDSVTFKDSYNDDLWNTKYHDVTHTRKFNVIRDELIESHKKKIEELQKEVDILEASDTFDKYNSIVYKSN